ncbi:zinc finger CCCH domain-containing protein 48-like [Silene latifolia]|uniref:zinc finger CCCH domain-containing protein 48-like n=1 Tax=Silene latifolia TaxID=37657 RepID=UPI003D77C723
MDIEGGNNRRVFNRLGNNNHHNNSNNYQNQNRYNSNQNTKQKVCHYWREGRCNRTPCQFLHGELPGLPSTSSNGGVSKRSYNIGAGVGGSDGGFSTRKNPNFNNTWGRNSSNNSNNGVPPKKLEKICNHWVQGNCGYGDRCKYLHTWNVGDSFSLLTTLEGHKQVVTGIALPTGKDKLYTGSKDGDVRIWDCATGQCVSVVPVGGEVGCMISEGPWIFTGLPNLVKAWNIDTVTEMSLSGPVGQVYTLVVGNDLLFAGTQDGSILAWKFNPATNCFEPAASLAGHTRPVVTMFVGANRLYSGSMDHSVRVWNLETLQCIQTLTDHTDVVMSVLCWDQFLLSASLDQTVKVWAATPTGNLEVTYTHKEEHGLLTLCGMYDSESKPIILCSSNDNTVRLYDLPSFVERGKIFSKQEIRAIQGGPSGLFFTGDGNGQVRVWSWSTEAKPAV